MVVYSCISIPTQVRQLKCVHVRLGQGHPASPDLKPLTFTHPKLFFLKLTSPKFDLTAVLKNKDTGSDTLKSTKRLFWKPKLLCPTNRGIREPFHCGKHGRTTPRNYFERSSLRAALPWRKPGTVSFPTKQALTFLHEWDSKTRNTKQHVVNEGFISYSKGICCRWSSACLLLFKGKPLVPLFCDCQSDSLPTWEGNPCFLGLKRRRKKTTWYHEPF